jgi:hypothetical protein
VSEATAVGATTLQSAAHKHALMHRCHDSIVIAVTLVMYMHGRYCIRDSVRGKELSILLHAGMCHSCCTNTCGIVLLPQVSVACKSIRAAAQQRVQIVHALRSSSIRCSLDFVLHGSAGSVLPQLTLKTYCTCNTSCDIASTFCSGSIPTAVIAAAGSSSSR